MVKAETGVLLWAGAIVSVVIAGSGFNPLLTKLLLAGIGGYLITLSTYTLNELFDMKEDMVNSPNRPLISGAATPADAIFLFIAIGVTSLVMAYLMNELTLIFFAVAFVMGVAYSAP
ncbi:MAG: UbiA family prenyltransferase [Conexivisphaerales archaeon]